MDNSPAMKETNTKVKADTIKSSDFCIEPQTLHIGAEILNVDLKLPLSEAVRNKVYGALLDWKVVFFRNQNLNHEEHVALARQFGRPTI